MKKIRYAVLSCLTGGFLFLPVSGFAATNVCSNGVGIPPFLSSGAKPNLLMVLDNSGSMLDAAYSDTTSCSDGSTCSASGTCADGTTCGAFCFDDSYDSNKTYAGYFQNDQWYIWTNGTWTKNGTETNLAPWANNTSYVTGDRVYVQGVIWEANKDGTSSGTSPDDDSGVTWSKIFPDVPKWKNNTTYAVGDIVWEGPELYKALSAGTSVDSNASNGLNLADSTGVTWKAVDSVWQPGKQYSAGAIVSYNGVLYETTGGGTANGTSVFDDQGVTWNALDEGSFVASSQSAASAACSNAAGTDKHTHQDLCISMDTAPVPAQVTAFAARGNLLNWAMASKFDVEKEILTGGKYNYYEKFLVNEHRGCSGSRLIKQLQLTDGKFLSLGVRSARYNDVPLYVDRVDSTDDTGRLEILAVTDSGYKMDPLCQAAIDKIAKNDGDLNGTQGAIDKCIASMDKYTLNSKLTAMRPALNHTLQACWMDDPSKPGLQIKKAKFDSIYQACEELYKPVTNGNNQRPGYPPSTLRPPDGGAYICYGVYDSTVDDINRVGYVGRVWNLLEGSSLTCNPWKPSDIPYTCPSGTLCYWSYDTANTPVADSETGEPMYKNEYSNSKKSSLVYKCTGGFYTSADASKQNPIGTCKAWQQVYKRSDGAFFYDDQYCGISQDSTTGGNWENTAWTTLSNPNGADLTTDPGNGILKAIEDYCDDLRVPEVIDPSDSAGKTSVTGGIPGVLRDSELMAFLGGGDPIATMKGHIYQAKRPDGIVHRVASDLRLGLMSFRYVGAKTECDKAAADTTSKLEKYCPLENKDGADLLTPLEVGDYVTDENDSTYDSGKRRHVDDLAEAINSTRATSWTPLAEALYEALGYYTQNINLCLNRDSNTGECMDFPTEDNPTYFPTITKSDPVQYWCQDNHILVITEGESTADINEKVEKFSASPLPAADPPFLSMTCPGTCTAHGQDACVTPDYAGDGDTNPDCTGDGLYGSAYLDNMTWWGQNVQPLYKDRCVKDASGETWTEKQSIYTHIVTTGALTNEGSGECNPVTLMTNAAVNGGTTEYYKGENPEQLEKNLYAVLDDILSRSSAGSAASVISSSRSGSGAVYQAVFWPKFDDGDPDKNGVSNKVTWVGDVHALFISSKGLMYEDSNQDGVLDETVDKRVVFYFSNAANKTRGCYDVNAMIANNGQCPEPAASGDLVPECGQNDDCVELHNIKYVWSANKQLADKDNIASTRKLFTWNDLNNDGKVDVTGDTADDTADDEWFKLNDSVNWTALNDAAANNAVEPRGSVTGDFLTSADWDDFVGYDSNKTATQQEQDALKSLVQWLQGVDTLTDEIADDNSNGRLDKALRSRQFTFTTANGGFETKTWRLGDVINSTPMVVAKPAEAYHYIYRDPTYAAFVEKWKNRRNMVYFGGNDGMLHAVNGGFYFNNKFCCTDEVNDDGSCKVTATAGTCPVPANSPWSSVNLGDELWAYIPYNLQPHLKCLADKFYAHKAYVDLTPRIFDVQIFPADTDHVAGWGTILVGAMRFGGAPTLASELNGNANDKRKFVSAYFVLDVTNPEKEPKLLGEMTQLVDDTGQDRYANMQYTTSSPAMIIMRTGGKNDVSSKWYLTLGNGPADLGGLNNTGQDGKIAIIPLEWFKGDLTAWKDGIPTTANNNAKQAFRIPDHEPTSSGDDKEGGIFTVPTAQGASFISDIVSVDYNIDLDAPDSLGARYRVDAVYFGTVDGTDFTAYPKDYLNGAADQFYWNGGGRAFRLVTKMLNTNGEEINSVPSDWAGKWTDKNPLRLLADVKRPVVGGMTVGFDGWNYWVYTGTGRFYSEKDKTDDGWCLDSTDTSCATRRSAGYFGFKEPLMDDISGFAGWASPPNSSLFTCKDRVMTWAPIVWDINNDTNDDLQHNNHSVSTGHHGLMKTDNILVEQKTGYLYCYNCTTDLTDPSQYVCTAANDCFPNDFLPRTVTITDPVTGVSQDEQRYLFDDLKQYIAGDLACEEDANGKKFATGLDGWYRAFHDPRERNLGSAALLGGLLTFTTYQPFNDRCQAEGQSFLYGVHYQTGTAWIDTVFGTFDSDSITGKTVTIVKDKLSLGRGLSTTPSLHVGSDSENASKAFIQTSTGEIIEIEQKNLPLKNQRSGRQNWTDQ